VCNDPIVDISKLSPELQEQVYRPGEDEAVVKEIIFEDAPEIEGE
jgi:hypothetical protein